MVERIQSPWTQPCGSLDRDEDPPRLDALHFAVAVAFFARSRTAVFSFPIVAGEDGAKRRRGESCGRCGEIWRRRESKIVRALFKMRPPSALNKADSEWLTGRPKQSVKSHNRRASDTWRKRRREDRGVIVSSHPSAAVFSASRASQNSDPVKSANRRATNLTTVSTDLSLGDPQGYEVHSTKRKEWIKATEREFEAIT